MDNIKVQRETYEKNGKQFYSYFIKGVVRGQNVKAAVTPPDIGGYTVLDIVFDGKTEADLVVTPFSLKNEQGETISGNTYSVRSVSDDGEVYECKIKPFRASDKLLLNMLLR